MTGRRLQDCPVGSRVRCTLDADARTFSYSVDGGAPTVAFEGLPDGRVLYPAVFVRIGPARFRVLQHYMEPHVGFVVRTRMLCQAGRARTAEARGDTVVWLCVHAPLWVVVRVCALLRDD